MAALNEDIERANEAAAILANPLVKSVFSEMEERILGALKSADLNDKDQLQARVSLLQTHYQYRASFENMLTMGEMEAEQVNKEPEPRPWYEKLRLRAA